jgi:diguanylate cyclase (GGDEF)-like protein
MTQQREPVCVLMIDIDRFKAINDTRGHAAGDQVLRFVARHLGNAVAETNAAEAVIGRLGGEEFAVVLRGVRASEAVKLADRLCEFVRASRTVFEGQEIGVTLSVGVSCGGAGAKIDELLRFADEAVYRAKQAGRDRWILATRTSPDVPVSASTRAA